MKLAVTFFLLSTLAFAQSGQPKQRFVCNSGYTAEQCHKEMNVVREILAKYHADWLGDWTWVLVKSNDWKPLLEKVGRDPDSPAFSVLEQRETFFEEALFEKNAVRSAELLMTWQMPLDRLTVLAVTHELGHALCIDSNEARASHRAEELQGGKLPSCGKEVMRAGR